MPETGIVQYKKIKLLFTIVDRGKGTGLITHLKEQGVQLNISFLGMGTANSQILDYLGLGETEKDVVMSIVREDIAHATMADVSQYLHFERPGTGIAFIVPIGSIAGERSLRFIHEQSQAHFGAKEN